MDYRHVIRYHRAMGPICYVLAGLEFLAYWFTGWSGAFFLTLATALLGALYLLRPFLVLEDDVVKVKNLFGMTRRRFPFPSLADLDVEVGAIVIAKTQRLRFSPWMTRRSDLKKLADAVRVARAARSPAPAPAP